MISNIVADLAYNLSQDRDATLNLLYFFPHTRDHSYEYDKVSLSDVTENIDEKIQSLVDSMNDVTSLYVSQYL